MTGERVRRIERLLSDALSPREILVKDQSHLHAGHAGAQDGKGHYEVRIVASEFTGKSRLERHRLIYAALGDMMDSEIHALKIVAEAPEQA